MITIDQTIAIEEVERILFENIHIQLSKETESQLESCFRFLKQFASDKIIYGINTGFGPMAQYRIDDKSLIELQYNIIRSHSAGAGNPLPDLYVKAAMLARLGTFVQAKSGIHPELVYLLIDFINRGIYPVVPEHGSVGASGDLVQMAHIALALIGEGEVYYKGERKNAIEVLEKEQLKPFAIHIREGLALTNGTSVMTGIGLVNLIYAQRLLDWAIIASVIMNEIASSYDDLMSEVLNKAKHHKGQWDVARIMREISTDSRCILKREDELYNGKHNGEKAFGHKIQAYYSLRCVPQILGPVLDTLKNALSILVNELNSSCDNPIIDPETQNVYHGGNFHGDYVSLEMDKVKIVVTKLTMLTERQLNYLCHNRINEILPPFVNLGVLGLNYGMQGSQFTATSTTAECQMLSNPMSVHSIPNNNDNQDIVSMGTNAALITKTVIDNSYQVMSIHFMALVQAVNYLKIQEKLSKQTRDIYDEIRGFFPVFYDDTPKHKEIECMKNYLMNKKLNYCKL
ncbi:MAG: aromatic amino acid ammonia-lyase [Oscillospiraceae bacterium]|jgi:histidine ammonia-lyase|nr:aromatic amino acid ammonia-lyase [Oscillospiraceae bacterium]